MKSMTGYGSSQHSSSQLNLEVSVRSVNGRFLDIRMHLPLHYIRFENDLKKLATQTYKRGTVDIFVHRKVIDDSDQYKVVVRKKLAIQWSKAYQQVAKEVGVKDLISMSEFAHFKNVFSIEEKSEVMANEQKQLKAVLQKAIRACDRERKREGLDLQALLKKDIEKLKKELGKIASYRNNANQGLQKRFIERLKKQGFKGEVDNQRIAQEVIIQIDKSDINEEVGRLEAHLKNFQVLVAGKGTGKKLDFYTQEILREINTIGSKSQVAVMTESVINAKTLVESIREQVQNIE